MVGTVSDFSEKTQQKWIFAPFLEPRQTDFSLPNIGQRVPQLADIPNVEFNCRQGAPMCASMAVEFNELLTSLHIMVHHVNRYTMVLSDVGYCTWWVWNFGCENLGADVRVGECEEVEIEKMRDKIWRLYWSRPGRGSREGHPRWGRINNSPGQ